MTIDLDKLLDFTGLMDKLAELAGLTKEQLGERFDAARVRVHGADVIREADEKTAALKAAYDKDPFSFL